MPFIFNSIDVKNKLKELIGIKQVVIRENYISFNRKNI